MREIISNSNGLVLGLSVSGYKTVRELLKEVLFMGGSIENGGTSEDLGKTLTLPITISKSNPTAIKDKLKNIKDNDEKIMMDSIDAFIRDYCNCLIISDPTYARRDVDDSFEHITYFQENILLRYFNGNSQNLGDYVPQEDPELLSYCNKLSNDSYEKLKNYFIYKLYNFLCDALTQENKKLPEDHTNQEEICKYVDFLINSTNPDVLYDEKLKNLSKKEIRNMLAIIMLES